MVALTRPLLACKGPFKDPMTTLPLLLTSNGVVVPEEVEEEMANIGAVAEYVDMPIERAAQGVEEPMPISVPLSYMRELTNEEPFHFGWKLEERAETVDEPSKPRELVALKV